MAKPPRAVAAEAVRGQNRGAAGKLLYYEALYRLNHGFEQILSQLEELDKAGVGRRRAWRRFQVTVEEARAEINFELVGLLQERELREWTDFGRLRQQNDKTTKADRQRNRLTKRGTQRKDRRK
jgi:hypothetical protein